MKKIVQKDSMTPSLKKETLNINRLVDARFHKDEYEFRKENGPSITNLLNTFKFPSYLKTFEDW